MKLIVDKKRIDKGMYWGRGLGLVDGCTPVTCRNCWAAQQAYIRQFQTNEKIRKRYEGLTERSKFGLIQFNGTVRENWDALNIPERTRKPTIFAVWNDLFHRGVSNKFLEHVWRMIYARANSKHVFIVLTKRPGLMKKKATPILSYGGAIPNLWLGVSVENQKTADKRIPPLLDIPATVRIVSVEPMLDEIDLSRYLHKISWIICGGETGHHARPMNPDWVRSLRDQCIETNVALFFKGWGNHKYNRQPHRLIDGVEHSQFPRVQK